MGAMSRYRVNRPAVINQTIDGEAVIINLQTGIYYSLQDTGAVVWSLVEGAQSLRQITDALAERYTATPELIEATVGQFLGELENEGLIVPHDGSPDSPDTPAPSAVASAESARPPFVPPALAKYEDMKDLMLLDPVHEVDDKEGWPHIKSDAS